jgi:Xaa-Pro aminopeptidase
VPTSGETVPPDEVLRAFEGVSNAIKTGFATLRAGVTGREVDQAARESITKAGFEEYQHAFGHQVGRMAHDGGTVLGPAWERYGESTSWELLPGEVYTLELGVIVPGGGYLGLEEMALVTEGDPEWLTSPLEELPLLPLDR